MEKFAKIVLMNKKFIATSAILVPAAIFVSSCEQKPDAADKKKPKDEQTADKGNNGPRPGESSRIGGVAAAPKVNKPEPKPEVKPEPKPEPQPDPVASGGGSTGIAKMRSGKAVKMESGNLVSTSIRDAEHYLLYFTASW